MQTYLKFALPLVVATSLLTLGVNALMGLVITIGMLDPQARLPFVYFQFLQMPFLSLGLPVVAVCALIPLCLKFALGGTVQIPTLALTEQSEHEIAQLTTSRVIEMPPPPAVTVEEPQYLKAA